MVCGTNQIQQNKDYFDLLTHKRPALRGRLLYEIYSFSFRWRLIANVRNETKT